MTYTTKFIDANIFIERWTNPAARELTDSLDADEHHTSVLVLTEVYHKLARKGVRTAFDYVRAIMGAAKVHDTNQNDLFNAMKNPVQMNINDKIHLEVMMRNGISTIISYDKDFDRDKRVRREEP